jgi:SAM-dependent methyltransferase
MPARRLDPSRVLALPAFYRLMGIAVGRTRQWRIFARDYVRARPGDRVLDVGCGPADLVDELPAGIDYVGFDTSERYVRAAHRRFGDRGRFFARAVDQATVEELGARSFDIVVAHGLLHHLDDAHALALFELARAALRPGGRLVTADGCFVSGQSRFVRWVLTRDRGAYVRTESAYLQLASARFRSVTSAVRNDSAWVPYTTVYLVCSA